MRKDIRKLIWMVAIVLTISVAVSFFTMPTGLTLMFAIMLSTFAFLACIVAWFMWSARLENAVPVEPLVLPDAPEALREWLEVATQGLGTLSRRRIVVEVTAHYNEALQSAQSDGVADAEATAFATLGDPKSAQRGFQQTYFSTREESQLRYLYLHTRNGAARLFPILLTLCGVAMLLALGFAAFVERESVRMSLVYMGVIFASTGPFEWYRRRCLNQRKIRRAKLTEVVMASATYMLLILFMLSVTSAEDAWFPFVVFVPTALWYTVREARLAQKLPVEASDDFRRDFRF